MFAARLTMANFVLRWVGQGGGSRAPNSLAYDPGTALLVGDIELPVRFGWPSTAGRHPLAVHRSSSTAFTICSRLQYLIALI